MVIRDDAPRRLLVLGGGGLLGSALVAALTRRRRPATAPPRSELDLSDPGALGRWFERSPPTAVINAAAYTDVVLAEQAEQREAVYAANRDGPARLAAICASRRLPLIHVSTDFVFDGSARRPYREDDAPAPLQVYGQSKLDGEAAVREAYAGALVVRTSTLFGPGRRRRPHYVDAILRQARAGQPVSVVREPVASPTYAPDLAGALIDLLDAGAAGLLHVVNAEGCSRLELARETVRRGTGNPAAEVGERPADDAGPPRPPYCVLDGSRSATITGRPLRSWRDALSEYIARWRS